MTSWQSGLEATKIWNLYYLLDQGSRIRELMRVSVCHGIHCQVSDRFLFVHKLRSVISSIFETIKQRRENGWLGNPWILICQQNENESGRWWKCAEWEVAADVGKEQTLILFFFLFVPDCSHLLPSQVDTMRATYCQGFEIAANLNGTASERQVVRAVLHLSTKAGEKSTGFRQTWLWSHLRARAAFQSAGIRPFPQTAHIKFSHGKASSRCQEWKCQKLERHSRKINKKYSQMFTSPLLEYLRDQPWVVSICVF